MTALEETNVAFSREAFRSYATLAVNEPKALKRINKLIEDIQRNGLLEGKNATADALTRKTA